MRVLSIIMIAIFSSVLQADIRFDDKSYIACNTCSNDSAFVEAAKNHYMRLFPALGFSAKANDKYIVFNQLSARFKTIRLEPSYKQLAPKNTEQAESFNSSLDLDAHVVANDAKDNILLAQYLLGFGFGSSQYSDYSKLPNWSYLGAVSVSWYGNDRFESMANREIEKLLSKIEANPFLYTSSNRKYTVSSSDGYQVTLVNGGTSSPESWQVAFARHTASGLYFDSSMNTVGKSAAYTESMECFISTDTEVCMEVVGDVQTGHLHVRSRNRDEGRFGIPEDPNTPDEPEHSPQPNPETPDGPQNDPVLPGGPNGCHPYAPCIIILPPPPPPSNPPPRSRPTIPSEPGRETP